MSDYSYLNDVNELTYGLEVAHQRFERAANAIPGAAELLRKWGNPDNVNDLRVCIGSFSLDGDSLSQWRAYGCVAIGFDVGPLMFGYNNSVRMNRVIYRPEAQERFVDLMAYLTASAYIEDGKDNRPDRMNRIYDRSNGETLLEVTAFFKHRTFEDEREVRLVHIEDPEVYTSLSVPRPPQRFRISRGILLPYLTTRDVATFPDKYPAKLPITEIVIGPSSQAELLERGAKALLVANGYESVPVKRSTAPLRSG
jgi:hypothetical protein